MVGLIRDGFSLRSLGLSGFIREIAFDLIVRINSKSWVEDEIEGVVHWQVWFEGRKAGELSLRNAMKEF